MSDRQWFAEGLGIHEEGEREYFAEGVGIRDDQAAAPAAGIEAHKYYYDQQEAVA